MFHNRFVPSASIEMHVSPFVSQDACLPSTPVNLSHGFASRAMHSEMNMPTTGLQRFGSAAGPSAHKSFPVPQQYCGPRESNKHSKAKQVLPCFNLICTGTCAYGPKCTFLHDQRAQLPKHVRKQAEFLLQSHLHTYRPNVNKTASAFAAAQALKQQQQQQHLRDEKHDEEDWLSDGTDCEVLSNDSHPMTTAQHSQTLNNPVSALTFCKDDIFEFPTASLHYSESNAKLYEPSDREHLEFQRELSMWYHLLAVLNEKHEPLALHHNSRNHQRRLPVFQQLAQGRPSQSTRRALF